MIPYEIEARFEKIENNLKWLTISVVVWTALTYFALFF